MTRVRCLVCSRRLLVAEGSVNFTCGCGAKGRVLSAGEPVVANLKPAETFVYDRAEPKEQGRIVGRAIRAIEGPTPTRIEVAFGEMMFGTSKRVGPEILDGITKETGRSPILSRGEYVCECSRGEYVCECSHCYVCGGRRNEEVEVTVSFDPLASVSCAKCGEPQSALARGSLRGPAYCAACLSDEADGHVIRDRNGAPSRSAHRVDRKPIRLADGPDEQHLSVIDDDGATIWRGRGWPDLVEFVRTAQANRERANGLADECGRLREDLRGALAKVGQLQLDLDRAERRSKR